MIIANTNVSFSTSHAKEQTHTEYESLEVQRFQRDGSVRSQQMAAGDKTSLSEEALELAKGLGNVQVSTHQSQFSNNQNLSSSQSTRQPMSQLGFNGPVIDLTESQTPRPITLIDRLLPTESPPMPEMTDPNLRLTAAILSSITGKPIELTDGRALSEGFAQANQVQVGAVQTMDFSIDLKNFKPPRVGEEVGMRYQHTVAYSEFERTSYSAQGEIHTADGQTISIDLMMEMSHSFATRESTTITAGAQLQDPLIINFNAPAADLTNEKFGLDINSDGKQDQISFTGEGSGFLMMDQNGDGRVNNGNELFGTQSGNGFADLRAYDDDGNGFIDEGDAAYSELKIWVKTSSGDDQYFSLADKEIGAIYLGAVQTPFEIKSDDNELQGVVRSSSFFLREDGSSGTVQQVDLVV